MFGISICVEYEIAVCGNDDAEGYLVFGGVQGVVGEEEASEVLRECGGVVEFDPVGIIAWFVRVFEESSVARHEFVEYDVETWTGLVAFDFGDDECGAVGEPVAQFCELSGDGRGVAEFAVEIGYEDGGEDGFYFVEEGNEAFGCPGAAHEVVEDGRGNRAHRA